MRDAATLISSASELADQMAEELRYFEGDMDDAEARFTWYLRRGVSFDNSTLPERYAADEKAVSIELSRRFAL